MDDEQLARIDGGNPTLSVSCDDCSFELTVTSVLDAIYARDNHTESHSLTITTAALEDGNVNR
jgi:hypothetical protein